MNEKNLTVKDLKIRRVIYLTGQIEALLEQAKVAIQATEPLAVEKDRLIEHIGYDPTKS